MEMKSHNCWFRSRRSQLSLVEPAAQHSFAVHMCVCVCCVRGGCRWGESGVVCWELMGGMGVSPKGSGCGEGCTLPIVVWQSKWIKSNIRLQAVKISCACLHFLSFTYVPLPECHSTRKIIPHVTPCAQLISIFIPPHAIFIFIDNFVTITAKT